MVDSALVIEQNYPIGIVTDSDFRSKVATGRVPITFNRKNHEASPVVSSPKIFRLRKHNWLC
jgi:CBS domain-containing protein